MKAVKRLSREDALQRELRFARELRKRIVVPGGLRPDERDLLEQSVMVLKMAQVSQQEVFPRGRGAILASLPPGEWNICWLRDGCYALMGLSRLGLFDEARKGILFYLNADAGYYRRFVFRDGKDHGVGSDYCLSVCRYFGNGREESDFNDNGPNIELDGFGLFLVTFCDYVRRSGDRELLRRYQPLMDAKIADPLLTFMRPDGLFRQESGPWEFHLPGRRYAFTAITASAGLHEYARLKHECGLGGYEKYEEGARILKNYIEKHLVYEGTMIKGFVSARSPECREFFDGSTFEAFNLGVFKGKDFFDSHYRAYDRHLRISPSRGFSRLNNPDWYTIGEWPFLDLRISMALNHFKEKEKARQLLDRVTSMARLNFNLVPEIIGYNDENYQGAVPMAGYGAAAYILTLMDAYAAEGEAGE